MSLTFRRGGFGLAMGLALAASTPRAWAQDETPSTNPDVPEWVQRLAIEPDSSAAKKYTQQQKTRVAAEKELRKLKMTHFGTIRKQSIRQDGILKLREYRDTALFPSLVSIFEREDTDVRTAVLDTFAESRSHEGDTALTWVGIFDDKPEIRAEAIARLRSRIKEEGGETPEGVKLVCYDGIVSRRVPAMAASAHLADELSLLEAIPWLINAQVQRGQGGGGGGGGNTDRTGDLAWIMVGRQVAFVSDLTPVVGPSAVAFDPQLSTLTEGVLLRVIDAAVVEYNYDIQGSLLGLAGRAMGGQDLSRLGFNIPAWRDWYAQEFLPFQAKKKAEADAKPAVPAGQTPAKPLPIPGKG